MKDLRLSLWLAMLLLLVAGGCKKDEDDDKDLVPVFLVESEQFTPPIPLTVDNLKAILANYDEADLSSLTARLKYDVEVYKITYKTAFEGDTIEASGVVAVPLSDSKKDAFPVLSYQHGTLFQKSQAPSLSATNDFMTLIAATGMVVVIPDYIGFGESAQVQHPYMHKEYTVNAVLDMIRASKEFIATEDPCETNDQLFMLGYSQGASATVAALSAIENNNLNADIHVTGAAAGSGAYNLNQFRDWIMDQQIYEKPSFIAYILKSYLRYTEMDVDYAQVFSEEFAASVPVLIDGRKSEEEVNSSFGTFHIGELFNDDFENDSIFAASDVYASMRAAFDANKVTSWQLSTPLTLYYGNDDLWVPGRESIQLYQNFQNDGAGSKVKLKPLPGADHMMAFPPTLIGALDWFASF